MTLSYRYGVRATTEQCVGALLIMSVQCIVGVVIQVEKGIFNIFTDSPL